MNSVKDDWLEVCDKSALSDLDAVVQVTHRRTETGLRLIDPRRLEQAFQACYAALAGDVGSFETVRMIEDSPTARTTIWLRFQARAASDLSRERRDGLLTYLARGTLTIIGWLAKPNAEIGDLCRALQILAQATLPDAHGPAQSDVVKAIAALQDARRSLGNAESARLLLQRGSAQLNLEAAYLDPQTLLPKVVLATPPAEIILIVEAPDYKLTGKWEVRHGADRLTATCAPGTLLDRFYRRELDVRPGDALHCRVRLDRSYGPDNELLSEQLAIVEVVKVLAKGETDLQQITSVHRPGDELFRQSPESGILEQVEGEFGVLTIRQIPIGS